MTDKFDLYKKLESMSADELDAEVYYASIISRILNVTGVGLILLALSFYNSIFIVFILLGIYYVGFSAVVADQVIVEIQAVLKRKGLQDK